MHVTDPVTGKVTVRKTGLGSSAALTVSLVGALLNWFKVVRIGCRKSEEDRRLVHNLAQLAHCWAQGKVGSGFDVSAAVYGILVPCVVSAKFVILYLFVSFRYPYISTLRCFWH